MKARISGDSGMKGIRRVAWLAAAVAVQGAGAQAEPVSETVFQYRAWEVQAVAFDDGSTSCVAQVSDESDSFSIWADGSGAIKLQFYSGAWDFGEGTTADLEVQIDRRAPWSLTNAELYLQSVLFNLPTGDQSTQFLMEVMRGNRLYLRNDSGDDVVNYTLSGSSASIRALIDCADELGGSRPANPFQ